MKGRYTVFYVLVAFFLVASVSLYLFLLTNHTAKGPLLRPVAAYIPPSPTPTPSVFGSYSVPSIPMKPVYRIAMVGDSMTAALGPHGGGLSEYLNSLYETKPTDPQRILIDNYAKSSNILAIGDELTKRTTVSEYTFGPLLSGQYDLILVESYGYNPLSQFGVEEGLKQQTRALDALMRELMSASPHTAIVFVATIAPNKENYAKATQSDRSETARTEQADERIAYIKNHIDYATSHHIPLINIYQKSLTDTGDGNMLYINPTDDIHPSFAGVTFIGHTIGDYIYSEKILPH